MIPKNATKVEILWASKVVIKRSVSFRSCTDISIPFEIVWSDPDAARQFSMSRWKCSYMTAYSVAPFYKGKLISNILLAPYFVTIFDVSFSKVF